MDYTTMNLQLEGMAQEEPGFIPLLSNASALIYQSMDRLNWAGFYLMDKGSLLLGPFQGKVACIRIPREKGVCGAALRENRTQLVPDVHVFPGHIACDSASQSEIVIPLRDGRGRAAAVLDIDSPVLNRFSEQDRQGLEAFAHIIEKSMKGLTPMEKTIYLAGGCFWGCQKYFDLMDGVIETEVGYANGEAENPTYEQVKHGAGHAETVRVVYDPARLPLRELLERYFQVIDPTAVNHQGEDFGIQYRTGIYYTDPADAPTVAAALQDLSRRYDKPLAVENQPLQSFYSAEEYHQKYLEKNPNGYCHIHFN
jgi:peptide methionine sulfoxide reductase msrA/msrB